MLTAALHVTTQGFIGISDLDWDRLSSKMEEQCVFSLCPYRCVSVGEQNGWSVGQREGVQQERRAVPGGIRHLLWSRHSEHADVWNCGESHGKAGSHSGGPPHTHTHTCTFESVVIMAFTISAKFIITCLNSLFFAKLKLAFMAMTPSSFPEFKAKYECI